MFKCIVGITCVILGFLFGGYVCLWMLFTGIIDIIKDENIIYGIILILFREIAGGIITFIMIITGLSFIASSVDGRFSWKKLNKKSKF